MSVNRLSCAVLLMLLLSIAGTATGQCLEILGDVNGNGSADVVDLQCTVITVAWATGGQDGPPPACASDNLTAADANCDGEFTIADAQILAGQLLGAPLPAAIDLDGNGCIDACQEDTCGDNICTGEEETTCPEDCGDPVADPPGSCCEDLSDTTGTCDDTGCTDCVCALDSFCCTDAWDNLCAECASGGGGFAGACAGGGCAAACDCEPVDPCGDDICSNDFGENELTCPADCPPIGFCGDDICSLTEQENESCPQDCGGEEPPPVCPGEGSCGTPNGTPGCDNTECCETVCALDPFCCDVEWDEICAESAALSCGGPEPVCGDGVCEGDEEETCPIDCAIEVLCPGEGSCTEDNGSPGCDDVACCETICDADPFCCEVEWDEICADDAAFSCGGPEPVCGDGVCEGDEEETCPIDCPIEVLCPGEGSCSNPNGSPGCDDVACCETVCDFDSFCCEVEWDDICAEEAANICDNGGEDGESCEDVFNCLVDVCSTVPFDFLVCSEGCTGDVSGDDQAAVLNLTLCAQANCISPLLTLPPLAFAECVLNECAEEFAACELSTSTCGDGVCEPGEETSCPEDCAPPSADCPDFIECVQGCPPNETMDGSECVGSCLDQQSEATFDTAINMAFCGLDAGCEALFGTDDWFLCMESNCGDELEACSNNAICGDGICDPSEELFCDLDCELPEGTCEGFCGGEANGCFCDEVCFGFGDCCSDVCEVCGEFFPVDCGSGPVCGDGICSEGEELTCPDDCDTGTGGSCPEFIECLEACPPNPEDPAAATECVDICLESVNEAAFPSAIEVAICGFELGCEMLVGTPDWAVCMGDLCGPFLDNCFSVASFCGDGLCEPGEEESCPDDCDVPTGDCEDFIQCIEQCPPNDQEAPSECVQACLDATSEDNFFAAIEVAECGLVFGCEAIFGDPNWIVCMEESCGDPLNFCLAGDTCGNGTCDPGDEIACPEECDDPPSGTCEEGFACVINNCTGGPDNIDCINSCIAPLSPDQFGLANDLLICGANSGCDPLAPIEEALACLEANCSAEIETCIIGDAPVCGDGECDPSEELICPEDCGDIAPTCDGLCGGESPTGCFCDELCFGFGDCCADVCAFCAESFPIDCAPADCGNDICEFDEDCEICPTDCGECEPNPCGDGVCDVLAGEPFVCPEDCTDLSDCCLPPLDTEFGSCGDAACLDCACGTDAFCCEVGWDPTCAEIAAFECPECGCLAPPECGDGVCDAGEECSGDNACAADCGACTCLDTATCLIDCAGDEAGPDCLTACADAQPDESINFLAEELNNCAIAAGCLEFFGDEIAFTTCAQEACFGLLVECSEASLPPAVCGDGVCVSGEECGGPNACPGDCGACTCLDSANCLLGCSQFDLGPDCVDECANQQSDPEAFGVAFEVDACAAANGCLELLADPEAFNLCVQDSCSIFIDECASISVPNAECGDGVCSPSEQCGQVNQCPSDCSQTCGCIDTVNCQLACGLAEPCASQCTDGVSPEAGGVATDLSTCLAESPCLTLPTQEEFELCANDFCGAELEICAPLF